LMLLIGSFSSRPPFRVIGDDQALLRVSFTHAAQRKLACRERGAAELAKLAPNMRAALDCPRERASMLLEVELDGALILRRTLPPTGFQKDGAVTLSHRLPVAAGRHRLVSRLRDRGDGDFNYISERTLDLAPGAMLIVDFSAERGGFVFRG
ncbi:MAG: hypothetical protein OEW21_09375, partial [Betaproteobacteria bacterium]|nr:hypothetical protein [Betaproteobacteria bacterium]